VIDDEFCGIRGLTRLGSPPRVLMASRMAPRSTTAGTPVKSALVRVRACRRFRGWARLLRPSRRGIRCLRRDVDAVFAAEQVFEQDLEAEGESLRSKRAPRGREAGKSYRNGCRSEGRPAVKAVHLGRPFYPRTGGWMSAFLLGSLGSRRFRWTQRHTGHSVPENSLAE